MKRFFLISALAANTGLFLFSCNDTATKSETTTVDSLTIASDSSANMPVTNEFVTKAATGGIMEVALGKLAQTNGSSQDVKEYGKMLETDHAAANATLQGIAASENIIIPNAMTDEQAAHIKDMEAMKGADFDKHFISMMVDDHDKDIEEFKKAAAGNANDKVKDFASKTLPTLQKHLDKAKAVKAKMK